MHTTPPMLSASTRCSIPVQPTARKISAVSSTVATVMPLIGFEELPICPVTRLETVTNRNAKNNASVAPTMPIAIGGTNAVISTRTATPIITTLIGRLRDVRNTAAPAVDPRMSPTPARSAPQIVGTERARLIRPAAVTAPAPM